MLFVLLLNLFFGQHVALLQKFLAKYKMENLLMFFAVFSKFKTAKRKAIARNLMKMLKLEDFFSLLSDETRLRCLLLLQTKGECCVCDLACALEKAQPKISRHLAILKGAGVVVNRRDGAWIYYYLHPKLPNWASRLLSATAKETAELYSLDFINLDKRIRTPACCEKASKIKETNEENALQDTLHGDSFQKAL